MTYRDRVNIKCCHTSRSVGQSPSTKKDFEEALDSKKRWSASPSTDQNVEQTDVLKLFSIQIYIATLQKYEMSLVYNAFFFFCQSPLILQPFQ